MELDAANIAQDGEDETVDEDDNHVAENQGEKDETNDKPGHCNS